MAAVQINLPSAPLQSLTSVATLAALRALPSSGLATGQDIAVDASSTAGDGGGGLFNWLSSSTADDDGARVIKPNDKTSLQAGRWVSSSNSGSRADIDNLLAGAKAQPQAQAFWAEVRANQHDVFLKIVGDSTGVGTDRWAYLLAQAMPPLARTHSIVYRSWTGSAWSAPSTLATGTDSHTIYIDNASVTGSTGYYLEGAMASAMNDGSRSYSLVLWNYGHNYGSTTTEEQNLDGAIGQIENLKAQHPRAGILLTLQNPRRDYPGQTANMVSVWTRAARMLGCGLIPVYSAFQAYANPDTLYLDDTHPNAAGSAVWRDVVLAAIAEDPSAKRSSAQPGSSFHVLRPNIAPNPFFSDYGAAPAGWSFTNVTPSKDPGRGESGYGLKLTNGAGTNPAMQADLSDYLGALRGKRAIFVARVWKPFGMDPLAGRIDLTASDQIGQAVSGTSYPRGGGEAEGGWSWAVGSVLIPTWAISLVASVYTGASSGSDIGKSIWVDQVWIGSGQLPGVADPAAWPAESIDDDYSASNVGKLPTNTGALTLASDDITVSGATAPHSEIFINMPGLVKGQNYRARWTYVSDTSGLGGSVLLRRGIDGGYATLQTKTMADGLLDFTAPAGAVCLQVFANSTATGWVVNDWSIKPLFSGIGTAVNLPLLLGRNADGSVIDATGGAGKFSQSVTLGTASYLAGENAQGNTKTDTALFELALGSDYVAGRPLTVTVNANTFGAGTAGTRTLRVYAYRVAANGTQGTNLGPAAQNLTGAAADYSFAVDGATLSPGDLVVLKLEAAVQETGGVSPQAARVSSVRVS
jgi:hypothetical protein